MLKEKMEEALNDQINAEFASEYIYLAMAAYFEAKNLNGFADWFKVQTQEEDAHAMKFYDYINERGGRVRLSAIEAPPLEWSSPLEAFEAAYKHECYISERINKLVDLARELSDHATENFLQWFVAEQVEEEATADSIVQQLRLIGDSGHALFMMDRELGQRTYTPPADTEE